MILAVENGSFGYTEGDELFRELNFSVAKGEVLSILGPNGVGKTTLLKCMMGMLPWKKGATLLNGRNINTMSARDIWRILGYVPQAKGGYLANTVEEMVLLGRSPHLKMFEQPGDKDREIAERVLNLIGIAHLRQKSCNRISGGELQMVLIARAMAAEPKILVMDEPESNLDFKNQLIILGIIEKLAKKQGISCIINTHYPEHALRVGNRALILCKNKRSYYGDAVGTISEEHMKDAFDVTVAIEDVVVRNKYFRYVLPLEFHMT